MRLLSKIIFSLCLLFSLQTWAFPDKPVKLIVALPVGSGPDVQLRKLATVLSEQWKTPVVVENRPGGSGILAINQLHQEGSDGYTIAMLSLDNIVPFPVLYSKSDLLDKIEPVAPFFYADMVLFASPQIATYQDLVQEIQKNSNFGSWAVGSQGHIAGALFAGLHVTKFTHVPYKEYGPWYVDTSNRTLSFGFTSLGSSNAMYKAGKIQYMAIAADRRDTRYPKVPTLKELTGKNIVSQSWLAFYVNKNVPEPIKQQIEQSLRKAMSTPEVQAFIHENFFISMHKTSLPDFKKQIERERNSYQQVLKKYNININ